MMMKLGKYILRSGLFKTIELIDADVDLLVNGTIDFNVAGTPFDSITIQFGGELSGGTLQLFSVMGGVRSPIADGGPFNVENAKDSFDLPVQRIVIAGRMDTLQVVLTGAAAPKLRVSIR